MQAWNVVKFLALASLALLASCTSKVGSTVPPSIQTAKLYEVLDSKDLTALRASPDVSPYLNALMNDPANVAVNPVRITTSLVSPDTKALTLSLNENENVTFQLRRADPPAAGMMGWVGDVESDRKQRFTSIAEVSFDPFNWISLVRDGDKIAGDIHVDGQLYRLIYVGNGSHVLVKVDESKLAPEAEPLENHEVSRKDGRIEKKSQAEHTTIRLLFVSTLQLRARDANYRLNALVGVQNANLYMRNSAVPITFEVAGYYDAPYDEADRTYIQQLADMQGTAPLGKLIAPHRDMLRADLVSMLSTVSTVCGVANLNAVKSNAFSVISCYGSLGHEVGHNLGAMHKWPEEAHWNVPPYAYGYRSDTPKFHTVMVTTHGAVPFFSNPELTYLNVPLGTREHNDTARRFNERREAVADFYPPTLDFKIIDQLNSCVLVHEVGAMSSVDDECPVLKDKFFLAMFLESVPNGMIVKLSEGGERWRTYRMLKEIPELIITPVRPEPGSYPNVEIRQGKEPLTGKGVFISSSRSDS